MHASEINADGLRGIPDKGDHILSCKTRKNAKKALNEQNWKRYREHRIYIRRLKTAKVAVATAEAECVEPRS